jgi:hypothetical protein
LPLLRAGKPGSAGIPGESAAARQDRKLGVFKWFYNPNKGNDSGRLYDKDTEKSVTQRRKEKRIKAQ